MRPCTCDEFVGPGVPWGKAHDNCRLCWQYHHDAAYRALWDLPGSAPTRPAGSVLCRHQGEMRREEQCAVCRGHVRVKVFACAQHGECTFGRAVDGLACCATCPDYDPIEPSSTAPPAAAAPPASSA